MKFSARCFSLPMKLLPQAFFHTVSIFEGVLDDFELSKELLSFETLVCAADPATELLQPLPHRGRAG